jgi:hypothetical protein
VKNVSDEMWYTWEQGQFIGANKPHCRVLLSKQPLKTINNGRFRSQLFSNVYRNYETLEIPTGIIKTLSRSHKIGTDASSMTLTLVNAEAISTGENLDLGYDGTSSYPTKRDLKEIGAPGALSYRRGVASDGTGENPWGYEATSWVDALLPNRVLWTFEGYGTDDHPNPWQDTKQVQTGIWLIDRVSINTSGELTVECRDFAKLLIEQRLYPPIVPLENYPLVFCADHEETEVVTSTVTTTTGSPEVRGKNVARHSTEEWDSSAAPWYGYNANVFGHQAEDAFDGDGSTYWISMRNSQPNADWSYEWIDGVCSGASITRIEFQPWKGNYKLYVGIMEDGKWQGSQRVPYNRNAGPAYPNTSDIPYVAEYNMPSGENWFTIDLDRVYRADKVRLVFTNLQWFGKIEGGDYRAGVRELTAYYFEESTVTTTTEDVEEEVTNLVEGNIDDYTDIVKLLSAWAGFYWPPNIPSPSGLTDDPLFLKEEWGAEGGRVWGDFFYSGAYPVNPPCIDASYWDNKSVMDAINQVKETLGFLYYIDYTGGAIFRPPNIWANGNYITGLGWRGDASIPIVAENNVILDYGITVDDAALRSEIIVVSAEDPTVYGAYKPGYAEGEETPVSNEANWGNVAGNDQVLGGAGQVVTDQSLLGGQQRIMLVPDYPFGQSLEDEAQARAEVEKFAYLVSLWIHWSYRKGKLKIPGAPMIDPDDQIRIYEAKTSEVYIHYILGINTTLNMDTGSYVSDIETHWLGNGPDSVWHVYKEDMPPALYYYLCSQQIIDCDGDGEDGGEGPWTLPPPPAVPPLPDPRDYPDIEVPYPDLPDINPADPIDDGVGDGTDGGSYPVNPEQPVSSCSNNFMWAYWPNTGPNPNTSSGKPYLTGSPAPQRYFTGGSGSGAYCELDIRAWPAFQLLGACFQDQGVSIRTASGKVIRKVSGTNSWSNHSWGVAADINYGPGGDGFSYGNSINEYPAVADDYWRIAQRVSNIRTYNDDGKLVPVFKWGEFFGRNNPRRYDPMHWQICVPAYWLKRGVWDISKETPGPAPI